MITSLQAAENSCKHRKKRNLGSRRTALNFGPLTFGPPLLHQALMDIGPHHRRSRDGKSASGWSAALTPSVKGSGHILRRPSIRIFSSDCSADLRIAFFISELKCTESLSCWWENLRQAPGNRCSDIVFAAHLRLVQHVGLDRATRIRISAR